MVHIRLLVKKGHILKIGERMIEIYLSGHAFEYETKDIVSLFYSEPVVFVKASDKPLSQKRGLFIMSIASETEGKIELFTKVQREDTFFEYKMSVEIPKSPIVHKRTVRRMVKRGILNVLRQLESKEIPWGILTGIRPTKILRELEERGFSSDSIFQQLEQEFGVSEEKANLMLKVTQNEKRIMLNSDSNSISIYLGIPFCPDRCLYCSFTTNPIKRFNNLVEPFMAAVNREIESVGEIIRQKGWKIETLYVGGGTPTSLNYEHMKKLLQILDKEFGLQRIKEITVEAGRPDTLDQGKIRILKEFGVNRISINPQTMHEATLKLIGRNHSVESIHRAFEIARGADFNNINMDIIAGLPGENLDMFDLTMKEIRQLKPESITIHTLALKKGSKLFRQKESYFLPEDAVVEEMLEKCRTESNEMGMIPYYMYRQKNMIGLQENVGYCMPSKECIYNIKMIEEVQNIIALGPGGVSRIMDFETRKINKTYNDRSTEGYISRIDEMIKKKEGALGIKK